MTDKKPISWVKQPVSCMHSPTGYHYIHVGFTGAKVVSLTSDCVVEQGRTYCAVEHEMAQEFCTCYAALVDMRKLLKNSYTSGLKRKGLSRTLVSIHDHLPPEESKEHWFVNLLLSFNAEANNVRHAKVRPYAHHRPRSRIGRKAFLLEKFVRRHMGELAPMFHVHPHAEEEKLVLRMGTTKILTCGIDLESQRRKLQTWASSNYNFHHSNSESRDCLFCNRTYYNMGSHVTGQAHIKRVAEAVNRARKIMSPEGIKGAYVHEQGVSFHTRR